MDDQLVVLDGSTFLVSEPGGDCQPGREQGLFHDDIRHLSTWRLLVDGAPLRVLTSRTPDHYAARVFATLADARVGTNPTVTVQRHRVVAGGLHEDLVVENHSAQPRRLRLEIQVDADFADLFEVKQGGPAKRGRTTVAPGPDALSFCYERDGFHRATVSPPGAAPAAGSARAASASTWPWARANAGGPAFRSPARSAGTCGRCGTAATTSAGWSRTCRCRWTPGWTARRGCGPARRACTAPTARAWSTWPRSASGPTRS